MAPRESRGHALPLRARIRRKAAELASRVTHRRGGSRARNDTAYRAGACAGDPPVRDSPVRRSAKFEPRDNLKVANALVLTIPPSDLAQADEVSRPPLTKEAHHAEVLRCGDLMPGCQAVMEGKDVAEVMAKGAEHAKREHGMATIPPDLAKKVQAAITDK